ncbi:MAG: sigma-70 family RNA polymerase sigma factor [Candidatus Faecousia sp.]|nr:sigma-70 family RNA polymerase sigma factor [Clostridiales bacterium]MDD7651562.1 sigma-70 family RNA polymerase sigma factor [Bacillota bacterium]MDY4220088.1 sigma-70 family RNA polymerase sigma factor [Candidatus Faecousia sp.]
MDDNLIIDLYWSRSEAAISETDRKYGPYCRSIAYGILQNHEDSEECVSDTWLRAWEAMPPQRPNRLSAFLGKITRNLALDRFDYHHAAKRSAAFDQLLSELNECIPDRRDDYAQLELTQLLNHFLRSLPREHRNLFLRRYWYCESIEDLAKRYTMSQSAVKSNLFRTRNKLKAYLEKEGVGIE